ncbi:MAG TPA: hypothetical protein VF472_19040 [Burkholderiaceae bacterium]
MSEIYLNIYCAEAGTIPATFPGYASLAEFTNKNPSRLCVGSDGSDVYEKLENAIVELGLAPLSRLNWETATEKIDESEIDEIFIKRTDSKAIAEIGDAIDALIAAAITNPSSLIVTYTQFNKEEAEEIARAASEPPLEMAVDDLSYYDLGESWDHFFYFLYVFRELCRESSANGKEMVFAWSFA